MWSLNPLFLCIYYHKIQLLARTLSSVHFVLFSDVLNKLFSDVFWPVSNAHVSSVFQHTSFAQSISKHAMSSSVSPASPHKAVVTLQISGKLGVLQEMYFHYDEEVTMIN